MIERIKTKPGYKILFLLFIFILPFYLLHLVNQEELNNLKDKELVCYIKNKGYINIDKDKIIGVTDNGFIFKNGYAQNCYIEKN